MGRKKETKAPVNLPPEAAIPIRWMVERGVEFGWMEMTNHTGGVSVVKLYTVVKVYS